MEGNVLFNDALIPFNLRLYGVRRMVKDRSDSERKPAAATWATPFRLAARVFYMHLRHTTALVTPDVEHLLEQEIAQWVHQEGSIRRPIAP